MRKEYKRIKKLANTIRKRLQESMKDCVVKRKVEYIRSKQAVVTFSVYDKKSGVCLSKKIYLIFHIISI